MGCPVSVTTRSVKIIERFGKFSHVAKPGLNWICCCTSRVAGTLSLRLTELRVRCQSKTKDNVFITIQVSVQYQIVPEKATEAFYSLTEPQKQIEAYVFDVVRSEVPKVNLDDVFVLKEELSQRLKSLLREHMGKFGFEIIAAPVTDIDPDAGVKKAMNEINRQERLKQAAKEESEGKKIMMVKDAEAQAEKIVIEARAKADAKWLQGQGLARQRQAIIDGLHVSVKQFKEGMPDIDTCAVMDLILLTQYFDTMKDIGLSPNSSTLFIPNNPGSVKDMADQMRQGILEAAAVGDPSVAYTDGATLNNDIQSHVNK